MNQYSMAMACAVLVACVAAQAADGVGDGIIERTCAPYDGPAFEVRAKRADGQLIKLMGMDALQDKPSGTWLVKLGAAPGSGSAALCDESKPVATRCALGESGSFSIKPLTSTTWDVSMSVLFVQGDAASRVSAHFTAVLPKDSKPDRKQPRC